MQTWKSGGEERLSKLKGQQWVLDEHRRLLRRPTFSPLMKRRGLRRSQMLFSTRSSIWSNNGTCTDTQYQYIPTWVESSKKQWCVITSWFILLHVFKGWPLSNYMISPKEDMPPPQQKALNSGTWCVLKWIMVRLTYVDSWFTIWWWAGCRAWIKVLDKSGLKSD